MNKKKLVLLALSTIVTGTLSCDAAFAQRSRFVGENGAIGKFQQTGQYGTRAGMRGVKFGQGAASVSGGQWQGPNGGFLTRGGGGAITQQGAIHGSAASGTTAQGGFFNRAGATGVKWGQGAAHQSGFSGTSANGSTAERGSKWAYQKGVGGQTQKGFNVAGANGSSATGYKNNNYDATTGTGTMNKGRDYNTADGQSYGYDKTTDYTKGQGFTTSVDTQNNQDYSVTYQKGQKPVVTPTSSQ